MGNTIQPIIQAIDGERDGEIYGKDRTIEDENIRRTDREGVQGISGEVIKGVQKLYEQKLNTNRTNRGKGPTRDGQGDDTLLRESRKPGGKNDGQRDRRSIL